MDRLLAGRAAASFIPGRTFLTLDKEQVTAFSAAIGVGIGRFAALVTAGDDLPADTFAEAIVKDKILALELVFQPFLLYHVRIVDDPPFQVEDIGKTLVKQVGAGLLTAYPTGTVRDIFAVFFVLQHVGGHRQLLAEGIGGHFQRIFKMADLKLIVVAHIHDNTLGVLRHLVEGFGVYILPFTAHF